MLALALLAVSLAGSAYELAVAPDGRVLVADFRADRVLILDKDLKEIGALPCPSPHGVAAAPTGEVYCATYRAGRVRKFRADGTEAKDWDKALAGKAYRKPVSLAVLGDGSLLVADYEPGRLVRVSSDGRALASFPAGRPHGVGAAGGRLYAADRGRRAVLVLDEKGKVLRELKTGEKGFDPLSAKPLPDGRVLAADYSTGRVAVFSKDGRFSGFAGEKGTPTCAVGAGDAVLLVDEKPGRLYKLALADLVK